MGSCKLVIAPAALLLSSQVLESVLKKAEASSLLAAFLPRFWPRSEPSGGRSALCAFPAEPPALPSSSPGPGVPTSPESGGQGDFTLCFFILVPGRFRAGSTEEKVSIYGAIGVSMSLTFAFCVCACVHTCVFMCVRTHMYTCVSCCSLDRSPPHGGPAVPSLNDGGQRVSHADHQRLHGARALAGGHAEA